MKIASEVESSIQPWKKKHKLNYIDKLADMMDINYQIDSLHKEIFFVASFPLKLFLILYLKNYILCDKIISILQVE